MIEIKNRLPTKPNRWKITHESDSSQEYVTWEYADEPTEVGTPINKGLYSRIYNTDIDPIGKINLYSTIAEREGFLLCDGSLISTIDYPDMANFANILLAVDTSRTFDYEYAGCDYSTSTEKLYFYKVTGMLIEVFETTNMQTFTKVTDYTLQYGYSPAAEYKNGAIIVHERRSSSSTAVWEYAITINNTNYATFSFTSNGAPVYDYYNKKLVFCYHPNSDASTKRVYTISDDSTSITYTAFGGTVRAYSVTYDKIDGVWLVGGKDSSSPFAGVVWLSSDNGETFSRQTADAQYSPVLVYNEYTQKLYMFSTSPEQIYEIGNVNDLFNSMNLIYENASHTSTGIKNSLNAKYPSICTTSSGTSVIMSNFEVVYSFESFNAKSMFAMGDYAYMLTTENKLCQINVAHKKGLLLPNIQDSVNRYYGYIKVEVD